MSGLSEQAKAALANKLEDKRFRLRFINTVLGRTINEEELAAADEATLDTQLSELRSFCETERKSVMSISIQELYRNLADLTDPEKGDLARAIVDNPVLADLLEKAQRGILSNAYKTYKNAEEMEHSLLRKEDSFELALDVAEYQNAIFNELKLEFRRQQQTEKSWSSNNRTPFARDIKKSHKNLSDCVKKLGKVQNPGPEVQGLIQGTYSELLDVTPQLDALQKADTFMEARFWDVATYRIPMLVESLPERIQTLRARYTSEQAQDKLERLDAFEKDLQQAHLDKWTVLYTYKERDAYIKNFTALMDKYAGEEILEPYTTRQVDYNGAVKAAKGNVLKQIQEEWKNELDSIKRDYEKDTGDLVNKIIDFGYESAQGDLGAEQFLSDYIRQQKKDVQKEIYTILYKRKVQAPEDRGNRFRSRMIELWDNEELGTLSSEYDVRFGLAYKLYGEELKNDKLPAIDNLLQGMPQGTLSQEEIDDAIADAKGHLVSDKALKLAEELDQPQPPIPEGIDAQLKDGKVQFTFTRPVEEIKKELLEQRYPKQCEIVDKLINSREILKGYAEKFAELYPNPRKYSDENNLQNALRTLANVGGDRKTIDLGGKDVIYKPIDNSISLGEVTKCYRHLTQGVNLMMANREAMENAPADPVKDKKYYDLLRGLQNHLRQMQPTINEMDHPRLFNGSMEVFGQVTSTKEKLEQLDGNPETEPWNRERQPVVHAYAQPDPEWQQRYGFNQQPQPEPKPEPEDHVNVINVEQLQNNINNEPQNNPVPAARRRDRFMGVLNERESALVNKGEELHQLIQMFETKKVASFFNRDSSEYTNAWNALKNFLDVRNSFRAAYNNYKQGKFASEDACKAELERLKPQFTAATERLTDNLKIYIASSTKGDKENKVAGNIGVEDKTQGAGVSRLVGAKGLLKYLGGEMQTVRSQEQQEADRVHEVTYQNLYKNTMNNLTERHASNKHRTSANVAQDILEERIKEERRQHGPGMN